MEHVLLMTFVCSTGEKSSMSISGVKPDLNQEKIDALMDTIIAKNIFTGKNGEFVKKDSAKVTERTVTKYDLTK